MPVDGRRKEIRRSLLITCPRGNTEFLEAEVAALGFSPVSSVAAGVLTQGTLEDTQRLNLHLRTAHRVLFLLGSFRADTPDGMYREVSALPWETLLSEDGYVSVRSFVDNPTIRDTRFANVKCKDAIVDRIRLKCGRRPDSGPARSNAVVFLHWKHDTCSVYLDTSGESLSHRGYRKIPGDAPLRETTAAAVVLATGWCGDGTFLNPMCGSGTLAIEAALVALGRAPGLLRSNFGFLHLKGVDRPLWDETRRQARKAARGSFPGKIVASDIRPEAVEAARKNAVTAGVDSHIDFRVCPYQETPVPDGGGVVVLNPEYGERMGRAVELEAVYRGIGDFFKQQCQGYTGYVFTGNPALAKKIGLRTSRRRVFFNGNIECRLLAYDLYAGTRQGVRAPE